MTNNKVRVIAARAFTLAIVVLLSACDGGIFGTGGPDDTLASSGLPDNSVSAGQQQNESGNAETDTDNGSTGSNDVTAGSLTDAGEQPDEGADMSAGTSDTAGAITNISNGTTGGATDGAIDGGTTDQIVEPITVDTPSSEFSNDTPTLSEQSAEIVVVNTSEQTLNIVSPAVSTLDIAGIQPNALVESTTLPATVTNLAILDNNNPAEVLVSYTQFDAGPSTLTTLLIRNNGANIDAVALVTETKTSDPGLAKVRVVQGDPLGDASLATDIQFQSAGDNPGGVDTKFGPLSFDLPQSQYVEVFAGDYELIDTANRFTPFAVTLAGNTVYTLVINGSGMNHVLIINDSDGLLLTP